MFPKNFPLKKFPSKNFPQKKTTVKKISPERRNTAAVFVTCEPRILGEFFFGDSFLYENFLGKFI